MKNIRKSADTIFEPFIIIIYYLKEISSVYEQIQQFIHILIKTKLCT